MAVASCSDWQRQHRRGEADETVAELPGRAAAEAEVVVESTAVPEAAPSSVVVDGICARYCPGRCQGQLSYSASRMRPVAAVTDCDSGGGASQQ